MAYLTYQELASRLSIPIGTLYAWVSQKRVPFVRLAGRLVRFDEDEINKWLAANASAPKDERQ